MLSLKRSLKKDKLFSYMKSIEKTLYFTSDKGLCKVSDVSKYDYNNIHDVVDLLTFVRFMLIRIHTTILYINQQHDDDDAKKNTFSDYILPFWSTPGKKSTITTTTPTIYVELGRRLRHEYFLLLKYAEKLKYINIEKSMLDVPSFYENIQEICYEKCYGPNNDEGEQKNTLYCEFCKG